jgi:hypothetical protein
MGWIYEVRREMGSDAMICIPSFIKHWFRHSEVEGGGSGWRYEDRIK